jgi:hypothetical protein
VLSGAHTLGRSRPERSGWGKEETKYTREGPGFPGGKPGGQSWTVDWLTFNNAYFKVRGLLGGRGLGRKGIRGMGAVRCEAGAGLCVLQTPEACRGRSGGRLNTSRPAPALSAPPPPPQEVKAKRDAELLVLPTDAAIFEDEGFRCARAPLAAQARQTSVGQQAPLAPCRPRPRLNTPPHPNPNPPPPAARAQAAR